MFWSRKRYYFFKQCGNIIKFVVLSNLKERIKTLKRQDKSKSMFTNGEAKKWQ